MTWLDFEGQSHSRQLKPNLVNILSPEVLNETYGEQPLAPTDDLVRFLRS